MRSLNTNDIQGAQPKKHVIQPRSRLFNSNASSINFSTGEQIMGIPPSPLKSIQTYKQNYKHNSNIIYLSNSVISSSNNLYTPNSIEIYQPISRIKSGYPQVDSIKALLSNQENAFISTKESNQSQINLNIGRNFNNNNIQLLSPSGINNPTKLSANNQVTQNRLNIDSTSSESQLPPNSNNLNDYQQVKASISNRSQAASKISESNHYEQQENLEKSKQIQKPWDNMQLIDGKQDNNMNTFQSNPQVFSSRIPSQQEVFEEKLKKSIQANTQPQVQQQSNNHFHTAQEKIQVPFPAVEAISLTNNDEANKKSEYLENRSNNSTNRHKQMQDSLRSKLAQVTGNNQKINDASRENDKYQKDKLSLSHQIPMQQQQNSSPWQPLTKEHRIVVLCESNNQIIQQIHRFFGMRNIANFEVVTLPGGPGCLVLSKDDSERDSYRNILNIFIKNLSKVYQIQEIQVFMNQTSIFQSIYGEEEGQNRGSTLLFEQVKQTCDFIRNEHNIFNVKGFIIKEKGIVDKIV